MCLMAMGVVAAGTWLEWIIQPSSWLVILQVALGLGFVPVRKPGKLPGEVHGVDYELEYGSDRLEIHADGFEDSPRILIVDDLLATGGTAEACGQLVRLAGGEIVGFAFVVELTDLGGRQRLPAGVAVESLVTY
jgi:adenine phosphoribosyltransferase